jgi:2-amino-4-hydroxy-6-hydroxymethyldihydropteridine diphosphokinase
MTRRAFIALGSNLQDPAAQVQRALSELGQLQGTRVVARSSFYRTAPVGYADQPDFINAVAEVATELSPQALLQALLALELLHGRERTFPNAPRVLDLDLLLYDDLCLQEAALTLPHPHMHERGFVLLPLAEIAPDLELPGKGKVAVLAQACPDQGVRKLVQ